MKEGRSEQSPWDARSNRLPGFEEKVVGPLIFIIGPRTTRLHFWSCRPNVRPMCVSSVGPRTTERPYFLDYDDCNVWFIRRLVHDVATVPIDGPAPVWSPLKMVRARKGRGFVLERKNQPMDGRIGGCVYVPLDPARSTPFSKSKNSKNLHHLRCTAAKTLSCKLLSRREAHGCQRLEGGPQEKHPWTMGLKSTDSTNRVN